MDGEDLEADADEKYEAREEGGGEGFVLRERETSQPRQGGRMRRGCINFIAAVLQYGRSAGKDEVEGTSLFEERAIETKAGEDADEALSPLSEMDPGGERLPVKFDRWKGAPK